MKIFYHGDMDGIVAGYLLCNETLGGTNHPEKRELYEFDYNNQKKIDDLSYDRQENIFFVDCAPDKEILDDLIGYVNRIFIIDHHVSREEMLKEYILEGEIDGFFYNGASASLLVYCWNKYIRTGERTLLEVKDFLDWFSLSKENQEKSDIPLSIRLVNSWDIWNGFYIDAEAFKIAFESKGLTPLDQKEIKSLLYDNRIVANTINEGYIMKKQIQSWADTFMKRYGYEVEFEGNKFFVANLGQGNSKYFGERIKQYDAVIAYCFNGRLWTFSIYSDSEKKFDCSEFAMRFYGGGHKKAAGFRMKEFPDWLRKKKKEEGNEDY